MEAQAVRKATLEMTYKGYDVAEDCVGFTYTDNADAQADHIEIRLQDRTGFWLGARAPQKNDLIEPVIVVEDWLYTGHLDHLDCGAFQLDAPTVSGPPDTVMLRGHAMAGNLDNRTQKKVTAWEGVTLVEIADDIAGRMEKSLVWEGNDRHYPRVEQKGEGDVPFLERLCEECGNDVKIVGGELHVIAGVTREAQAPACTFRRSQALGETPMIKSYTFLNKGHDTYGSCVVRWTDEDEKKTFQGGFDSPDTPSGEALVIRDRRVASDAEAEELAKQMLRTKNKNEKKVDFTLLGDVTLRAGDTCRVEEFGVFSGGYIIEQAVHKLDQRGGYETTVHLRRVLGF